MAECFLPMKPLKILMASNMEKKYIIILVAGEYDAHDFVEKHKGETFCVDKWETMLHEEGLWYNVRSFDSEERMNAYISAIGDVENYLSDDFYTFGIITSDMVIEIS